MVGYPEVEDWSLVHIGIVTNPVGWSRRFKVEAINHCLGPDTDMTNMLRHADSLHHVFYTLCCLIIAVTLHPFLFQSLFCDWLPAGLGLLGQRDSYWLPGGEGTRAIGSLGLGIEYLYSLGSIWWWGVNN